MKAKLSAILGTFLLVLCGGCFMTFGATSTVGAEELPEKTYNYSLSQSSNNKITIKGTYTNQGQYTLSNNATFDRVMEIIDADRLDNTSYNDATINFDDIRVFDTYLALQNGNYTLTGTLTGLGYLTYGLIYVNGANVTFENATFTNNGLSYLVKNEGNGNLTFKSGTYISNDATILSINGGDLTVNGGRYVSNNTNTIIFTPSTEANLTITKSQDTSILITSTKESAVVAKNANVDVGDSMISSNNKFALDIANSTFNLSGQPTFKGKTAQIAINNQFDAEFYTGTKVSVSYLGDVVSGTTIAVTNATTSKFELADKGYTFCQLGNNIVINKTSNVIYKDSRNFITTLPVDEENYILAQTATIEFVADASVKTDVLKKYNLLGWSTVSGATTAEYTKDGVTKFTFNEEKDLVLYAVWQPITFTITYEGIEGSTGGQGNPTTYNVDQTVNVANLEKQYYDFLGWTINGKTTIPATNFVLPKDVWGDITLKANWAFAKYNIVYNGVESSIVQKLGLKTYYTIDDTEMFVNANKFLVDGFSCYGVFFDENKTLSVDEIIYFKLDKQDQNSQEFLDNNTIGEPINFYVDLKKYYQSGDGSSSNPYIIKTAEQFSTFVTGVKTTSTLYVKLANNLQLEELAKDAYTGFENINFDGNNKTLTVSKLNQVGKVYSVFPFVTNSTIQNLKIVSTNTSKVYVTSDAMLGGAFGELIGCNLNNILVDVDVPVFCTNAPAIIKAGGVAVNVQNSTINNVKNLGKIVVAVGAQNGSANVYASGIVGGEAQNSTIINCQSCGDINVVINKTTYETRAYLSAIANLGANNKVYNCIANCEVIYHQKSNNVAFISGALMALGESNVAKNLAWLGEYQKTGATASVIVDDFVGANQKYITTENLWVPSDFTGSQANNYLNQINNARKQYASEVGGEELLQWFFTADDQVSFEPLWKVKFISESISAQSRTLYLTDIKVGEDIVFNFDTETYKFFGWEDNSGKAIDWENIDKSVLTVYGHYELWSDLILKDQIYASVACGLILLGVLFIMYLFDKKKSVKFVLDGKVIEKIRVGRRKRFAVPEKCVGTMWFFDHDGKKPFQNQRMKFHPIKLFAFTGEKQEKFEAYWKEQERLKQEALEKAKQEQLQKQKEAEEKALALKKEKEERKNKNKKKAEKATGITIIKKEIKIINNQNEEKLETTDENDDKTNQ